MSIEGMRELNRRLDAIASAEGRRKMIGRIALVGVDEAKRIYEGQSKQTGNLGRTIRLGRVTERDAEIIAGGIGGVGYAGIVERGSRPHKIRPRRGRCLRWPRNAADRRLTGSARTGTSDFIWAREVNHPGTRPKPYLVPGAIAAVRKAGLREQVIKAWNDAA